MTLHQMKYTSQLTVYYDGSCPLCSREIGWYQKQKGGDTISWLDVSESTSEWVSPQLSTCDALRRLHVKKVDGTFVSGAAAFSALWLELPRFKMLGLFIGLPFMSSIAEFTYRLFLKIRPSMQRAFK